VCAGISATSLQGFLNFVKKKYSNDTLEQTIHLLIADTAGGIALGLFHFAASGVRKTRRAMRWQARALCVADVCPHGTRGNSWC
jgi:hypothetical protein